MKSLIKVLCAGILVIACACEKEGESTVVVTEFPIEESLDSLRTLAPVYSEHMTNSLSVAGDYYVSINYRSAFNFSVYDQDFQLVDTILPVGHGHNEMMSAMFYGQWSGAATNPEIYVFESESNKLSKINIAPFTGVVPVATLPSKGKIQPSRVFFEPDSTVLGVSLTVGDPSKIFKYDIINDSLTFVPEFLTFDKTSSFYTSQCGMAVRDDGKQVAIAYTSIPLICLFDKNLNLRKKIFIGEEVETSTLTTNDHLSGFGMVKYLDDKILALRCDFKDLPSNKLMVFDKDGNPVASYALPYSLGFCYNEKQGKLISQAYDKESGTLKIYEYAAPASLKK